MKKILYIISSLILLAAFTTSCNVTREPKGTVDQAPFSTASQVAENRDALYALLRGVESPNNLNTADIQSDLYHLTFLDNNSLAGLYSWERQSIQDHDRILGYYASYYSVLMQANYFLWRSNELLGNKKVTLSNEDKALVKQYIGEIKVMRALAHWRLVTRFSKPWDGETDDQEQNGIIEMYKYAPLEVAKAKKSSRKVVYDNILKDLNEAIAAIPAEANKDVKPAMYITKDYANAIKARVCLFKRDYQAAVDAVDAFINEYPLTVMTGDQTADVAALDRIWKTEDSSEILVRLYATTQQGARSSELYNGGVILYYGELIELLNPSLILEPKIINLYKDNDIRKIAYIGKRGFKVVRAQRLINVLTKFEGNPSLDKDKKYPEHKFGVHLFNVGEAYLIKAEALLQLERGAEAFEVLKTFRKSRGLSTSEDDYPKDKLILDLLKEERIRELIGEGFRLNDLLRWGEAMERDADYQKAPFDFNEKGVLEKGRDLKIEAGNQFFIWEFPIRDMENNSNLNKFRNWK